MIFELVKDFADAVAAMPADHPKRRILRLLEEAIRRDVHFIDRHPTTMFQCMWNTCWWYDSPEAANHFVIPAEQTRAPPPWELPTPNLHELLELWRAQRRSSAQQLMWLRSLRPPVIALGTGQRGVLSGHDSPVRDVVLSPDESTAISVDDRSLRLWDMHTGQERFTMVVWPYPRSCRFQLAFSPNGRSFALSSRSSVRIWDVASGQQLVNLPKGQGDSFLATALAYSADGRWIAASCGKTVCFWKSVSGKR